MTKHSSSNAIRRTVTTLAAIAGLALIGPIGLAQANDTTNAQYHTHVAQIAGEIGGGGGGSAAAPAGLHKKVVGGLPFTGLDVFAMAAVAIALTSMGFALRRLTAGERHIS